MVSILTITYNRGHLIRKTIESVLSQSYKDFEYVIVDDGSDDNTQQIIEEIAEPRIRYFKLPKIGYLSRLRNYGFKKIKGDFIALLDSDDVWNTTKLQVQMESLISNPNLAFSFCDVEIYFYDKLTRSNIYDHSKGEITKQNFFDDYINGRLTIYSSSTIVFKREVFETIGVLNEDMKSGDHDFICRLLLNYKGCQINKSLTKIMRHDQNHSRLAEIKPFQEYISTLKNLYKEGKITRNTFQRMVSFNYYQSGLFYSRNDQPVSAKPQYLKSFKTYPLRYKALIRYLLPNIK